MNDIEAVQKLAQHGFNGKEIRFIKIWAGRKNITYSETIRQLYRVFIGVALFLSFITCIAIWEFFNAEWDDFFDFLIAYFFVIIVFFIFAPMKLGAKIFFLIRRGNTDY